MSVRGARINRTYSPYTKPQQKLVQFYPQRLSSLSWWSIAFYSPCNRTIRPPLSTPSFFVMPPKTFKVAWPLVLGRNQGWGLTSYYPCNRMQCWFLPLIRASQMALLWHCSKQWMNFKKEDPQRSLYCSGKLIFGKLPIAPVIIQPEKMELKRTFLTLVLAIIPFIGQHVMSRWIFNSDSLPTVLPGDTLLR